MKEKEISGRERLSPAEIEKHRLEFRASIMEDIRSTIDLLRGSENQLEWMPLRGLYFKIKKYVPEYNISWEELGITEEEFRDVFKRKLIKIAGVELAIWRKETYNRLVLVGFINAIEEFVSEGICTYEELGTSKEEITQLTSLPWVGR